MIHERTTITVKEFLKDAAGYFAEVAEGNETLLVQTDTGALVEVRPIDGRSESASNGKTKIGDNYIRRSTLSPEERLQGIESVMGAWADFDADTFLKNLYESRDVPGRDIEPL